MTYKFTERSLMSGEADKIILHWITGEKTLALVMSNDLVGRVARSFPGKTTAPTANEDSGDGYIVGDIWLDETADKAYVCLDNTLTAAVWTEITQSGGSIGLNDLTDVDTTGLAQGNILYYNGSSWVVLAPGVSGQFLKTQGAAANPLWDTPAGSGDVVGPAASVDNAIARFDGVTGKLLQDYTSNAPTISDTGDMNVDGDIDVDNVIVSGNVDGRDVSTDGSKLDGIEALADVTDAANVEDAITGAGAETLTDASELPFVKAVTLVKITWANFKAAIKAYTDTLYEAIGAVATHAALTTGVHGVGAGTVAKTADITATKLDDFTAPDDNIDLDATAALHGLMSKAYASKLDGIEAAADVTDATNVDAAGAVMESDYNANTVLAATADNTPAALEITEQTVVGRITSGNIAALSVAQLATLALSAALPENVAIILDAALSADGKYSGIVEAGTAGAALAFGDIVYLQTADSRWELASANDVATGYNFKLGICVLAAAGDGSATTVLLWGKVRADTAFPTFTVGAPVYLGTTAGDVQVAAPSGNTDIVRIVGFGNTGDELFFCPSNETMEITA